MKNKQYCTIKTVLTVKKIVERGKIDTPNTQIHDRSLSWLEICITEQTFEQHELSQQWTVRSAAQDMGPSPDHLITKESETKCSK
jgi:hypothetical protein